MTEEVKELKDKVSGYQIRERIFALFCLTVIAIVAMYRLADPENIVINVIVSMGSFMGGVAVGHGLRKADKKT